MLGMLAMWLQNDAPTNIKKLVFTFPVPGHSFMPPDRVFGRIEKIVRKQEVIVEPKHYFNILDRFGTVIHPQSFFRLEEANCRNIQTTGIMAFQVFYGKEIYIAKDQDNSHYAG